MKRCSGLKHSERKKGGGEEKGIGGAKKLRLKRKKKLEQGQMRQIKRPFPWESQG